MVNTNKRSAAFLVIIMLFLILLVLFVLLYMPTNSELSAVKDQKNNSKNTITTLQNVLEKKEQSAKVKFDEETVQAALPLWDDTEQIIVKLKEIGLATEADLTNGGIIFMEGNEMHLLSNQTEPIYTDVQQMNISLKAEGKETEIIAWIDSLENLPRMTLIKSLRIIQKNENKDSVTADLTLTAYLAPQYQPMLDNPILPLRSN
ncbi:hypothetical protein D3C76_243880 [compost metagenome]